MLPCLFCMDNHESNIQGSMKMTLPPTARSFDQAVVLVGRQGIAASQMAWGETRPGC
jgi:hypothetical protein